MNMDSDDDILYVEDTSSFSCSSDNDEFIADDDVSMEAVTNLEDDSTTNSDDYFFEILPTDKLVQYMLDTIREVNSIVEIPATTTRFLLHHFNWDTQKLMEKYYDGDEDKLFAEARVVNPFKTPRAQDKQPEASLNEDCGICLIPSSTMTGLECGHRFCKDCWNEYLTVKIMGEGVGQTIACAAHKCDILVDDTSVMNLLKDSKVRLKYQQLITNSFVDCNKFLRWCPTVDCNHAIKVQSVEAKPVTCRCNATFCFACGDTWHAPINCQLLRKWIKQCEEDSANAKWMAENSKDCPKCATNIEKNGGCNYVVCQKCRQQFCWICRRPTVNYSAHPCANFKPKEPSKEVLQRYLFYNFMYTSHRESLELEKELYAKVNDKMEEMQQLDMSWIEVQFLRKAVDVLRSCRQTLMYTYAFAFYLKKNNQTVIFEDNQKDLENSVEILSGYLERDIAEEDLTDIKQKVQDKYRYCEGRRKVLLKHVQEGNEDDWWELIKT